MTCSAFTQTKYEQAGTALMPSGNPLPLVRGVHITAGHRLSLDAARPPTTTPQPERAFQDGPATNALVLPAGSYQPKYEYSYGILNSPGKLIFRDLNSDGKPELVSSANSQAVYVFQNNTTPGAINATSFAGPSFFSVGASNQVAAGDLDNDGKPDLVAVSPANDSIIIFHNTSTGSPVSPASFAERFSILVPDTGPTDARFVLLNDLDGDGRLDLLVSYVASSEERIIFLRNNSTGPLSGASFSLQLRLVFPGLLNRLMLGDIDLDGKTDVLVNRQIFRNTSVTGQITVATPVDVLIPSSGALTLADIDGDKRKDLLIHTGDNTSNSTLSVWRNNTTVGNISASSFDARVDFSVPPGGLDTGDIDRDGKVDIAIGGPSGVTVLLNTHTTGAISSSSLSAPIAFPVQGRNITGVTIGDLNGDGIPEMGAVNAASGISSGSILILQRVQAAAVPPVINSISASKGAAGSTLTITGQNFDAAAANNLVFFGNTKATVTAATGNSLTVTVPGGASYKPLSVFNPLTALTGSSADFFLPTYNNPAGGGISPATFEPRIDFAAAAPASAFPYFAAAGDLDGDDKPDLAVVNANSNSVTIMRNTSTNGTLNAASFLEKFNLSTSFNPLSVLIADLDGDGRSDLIVTNNTPSTVSVFRNIATPGSLSSASFARSTDFNTASASYPYSTAVADINGDGKPDLIVANNLSNTVSVLLNQSVPGAIASSSFGSRMDFATGAGPRAVMAGDVDRDGKTDLVVACEKANALSVLLNRSAPSGNAAFTTPLVLETGNAPVSVAFSDVNGDARLDILTANNGSNTVSVFENISSPGASASLFRPKVDVATGRQPFSVAAGDIDGDGRPDIAVANAGPSTLSVLRNGYTTGNIGAATFAGITDFATGGYPVFAAIVDLDVDGYPEALTVNAAANSLSVFRLSNISAPQGPPVINLFSPAQAPAGATVTIAGSGFNSNPGLNTVYFGAVKALVTGGSSTSLTVTVPTGATHQPISVLNAANSLIGYSPKLFSILFPNPFGNAIPSNFYLPKFDLSLPDRPSSTLAADLDQDGKPDLLSVTPNPGRTSIVSIYRNTSGGGILSAASFAPRIDLPISGGYSTSILTADLDGDGKKDLVVNNAFSNIIYVLRNSSVPGNISFEEKVMYPSRYYGGISALTDIDGDGKTDIVVGYSVDQTICTIYRNNSVPGGFNASSFVRTDLNTVNQFVGVRDIDVDGKPDLLVNDPATGSTAVLHNIAMPGSITEASFSAKILFGRFGSLFDVDGDGKTDLVATDSVRINTSVPGSISSAGYPASTTGSFSIIEDADGDGKPDIIGSSNNALNIQRNVRSTDGRYYFAPPADFPIGYSPFSAAGEGVFVDLNGDGLSEAIVGTGALSVLQINPVRITPAITSIEPQKAPIGTTVIIKGANFNPTPANNIVYFGATRATVTAGTSSELQALVPLGALYKGPTLLNATNGLAAAASQPFIKTFTSPFGSEITSNFYLPRTDFTTAYNPYGVAIGDLNGDGKPDLATANFVSSTITVLRNAAGAFGFDQNSFTDRQDLATGDQPTALAISDMDGDGKLDIVVVNHGASTVSVFRNTTIAGANAITFNSRIDYTVGNFTYPIALAVGDLDLDGKPEIVAANTLSNTVAVLRNLSAPGSLTAASFAPRIEFTTGTRPHAVVIGDVDGDYYPDLVIANETAGTVSVLRNQSQGSTLGAGFFSPKTDFAVGSKPFSVAMGDLNSDSIPDLVVTNFLNAVPSTLTALANRSVPGTVSFAAAESLPSNGASPFSVTIGDANGDGQPDILAVNSGPSTLSVLRRRPDASGSSIAPLYDAAVQFPAGGYPIWVQLGDVDLDGLTDVVTANGTGSVSVLRVGGPMAFPASAAKDQSITDMAAGSGMQVYPNPSRGIFTLQLTQPKAAVMVEVLDAAGNSIQRKQLQAGATGVQQLLKIDLAGHPAGVYYVKVTGIEGVQVRKVVVQR